MIQRDAYGRWLPGQSANPAGRPARESEALYLATLRDAITPEKLRDVLQTTLTLALQGDIAACKLVLLYSLGRPPEHLNLHVEDDAVPQLLREIGQAMRLRESQKRRDRQEAVGTGVGGLVDSR